MTSDDRALWLVNVVIVVTLLEGVLLVVLHVVGRRGPAPSTVLPNLAAGLCLLGALRAGLGGADWRACAAWLSAAGVAHAIDLRRRWPANRPSRHAAPASPVLSSPRRLP